MGAIKDIFDLTTQLSSSVQDRKLAAEILQIQTLILSVQRENSAVVTENLNLKKKIFELEKVILNFQQEQAKVISRIQNKYVFDKTYGIFKSKESDHFFCTSCLMKNIESPLTVTKSGWRCELKDCGKFYSNPSFKPKRQKPISYF
jgi:regulator of replication initiation timing